MPGLGSVLTIANHRLENYFNSQELGAGPRIALGTEDYESAMILFHYPAVNGSGGKARTCDPRFNRPLLYQLSYTGILNGGD